MNQVDLSELDLANGLEVVVQIGGDAAVEILELIGKQGKTLHFGPGGG